MSDFPTDDGFDGRITFHRRGRGWTAVKWVDPPALGEDQSKPLGAARVVRSDYRSGTALKTKGMFGLMFQEEAAERHVPLWGVVGKMMKNIQFLRDQGYDEDTLMGAWQYFKTQLDMIPLQGSSLWDEFFARRMEAFRYAANASIGSRDGTPTESLEDFARRKMLSQQKEADDGAPGEG